MKLALPLARRGMGKTSPNPMVGAVIVKGDRIIGKGYHRRFGGDHAEVDAIKNASESVSGATMYVTLEPCCHHGKTPPCTDAIIKNKIRRVVIGTPDPNPRVNGRGMATLKKNGIEVISGVLEEECRSLNEAFFRHVTTGLPLVTVKFAQTLDGRIAAASGSSQWISSAASRRLVHKLRAVNDAVMVGIGTMLADDPELTVRHLRGRNPIRVILDSRLSIPLEARVLGNQGNAPTIIATTNKADKAKLSRLKEAGIEVLEIPGDEHGRVDLNQLLVELGKRGISSVLAEGGAGVITALLRRNLADKIVAIVAPKILGKGIETVGDLNISDVNRSLKLSFTRTYRRDDDLVIEAKVIKC
ncbi:bifunctional diaminohydroxyphosphoribosylaminopyrimidine deaminase/5-amino-6-(5-phosphoribosylamino)uracil reductase RibD [Chloroflexota bacterium]